jgi:cation diffusion facilitator family transporter
MVVALAAGLAVAVAKLVAGLITGSPAMVAEAAHSFADFGNDSFLLVAQVQSRRPPDQAHPLGYGREAYFWALFAALGVFLAGAAFSLREGIASLMHPTTTSSSLLAYVVLGVCTVFDLISFRQSAGQMVAGAQRSRRSVLVTPD